ncbi:12956_t:CDS:2, partial [Cetraspora pellucida]
PSIDSDSMDPIDHRFKLDPVNGSELDLDLQIHFAEHYNQILC